MTGVHTPSTRAESTGAAAERSRRIATAFAALAPTEQQMVWLRRVEGWRPVDVARALGVMPDLVDQVVAAALQTLRREIASRHPLPEDASTTCRTLVLRYRHAAPPVLARRRVRELREHARTCDDCLPLVQDLFTVEHCLGDALAQGPVPADAARPHLVPAQRQP